MRNRFRWAIAGLATGVLFIAAGPLRAADRAAVEVEISGIDGALLENVRALLTIDDLEERRLMPRIGARDSDGDGVTAAEVRRRHRVAPKQIRDALMPFGYYRPQIDATLEESDGGFEARYHVDPGEPARLREVTVRVEGDGRTFPAVRQVLEDMNLEPDQRLDHGRYESLKTRLFNAAYDNGFLDAAWETSTIRVAPDRLSADIALVLRTGPRFSFGETEIMQEVIDPAMMAGFVEIEPGDPYDIDRLLALQRVLSETGYFRRVEVRAPRQDADADHRVPVTVRTEPSAPQRYSVGLGYGTDTGPRATLSVLLRHLNARGHRLRADLQVSTIEQAIGARYEIPIRNYATDSLSFSATVRQQEVGDADTDQIALGVSQVVSWFGFRRRLYLQAERENFEFGDGPTRTTNLVYPGITLTRERADDLQYPRRGYSVRADLRSGVEALLSDVSFSRLSLSAGWTRGLAARTRVLLRAEAGVLWTDDFADLPPSQRFFAGGDRSIRGYPFRDVGPVNVDGDVIGGERLLSGSIELEHLFYGNYGAAIFVDAGDAFDRSPDFQTGAGVGFRWRSPVGMVRLDVAHPFDDPDDDFRIHLTIGADL